MLFVHNDYARFSGEERAVEQLARLASERMGHEVVWWRRSSAVLEDSPAAQAGAFFSGIYSPAARREIGRILDRERIDLVQAQNLYPLFSPSVLAPCRERGIPVVLRCPNYRLFCANGLHVSDGAVCERCVGGHEWQAVQRRCAGGVLKSTGYALRNAYARSRRLFTDNVSVYLVLSEFQRRLFASRGVAEERLAYLPNIASPGEAGRQEANGDGSYVAFCGRWSPEKGTAEFLAAARRLPGVPFKVAGALRSAAGADPVPANVEFVGHLTGDALTAFYRNSRVVVVPSKWYEGFPNVILEAMTCARPVIGTRIGAIPEIVDEDVTGLLAAPGDPVQLAARVEQLWRDPAHARRLGEAGRRKAETSYSEPRVVEYLADAYERARRLAIRDWG